MAKIYDEKCVTKNREIYVYIWISALSASETASKLTGSATQVRMILCYYQLLDLLYFI